MLLREGVRAPPGYISFVVPAASPSLQTGDVREADPLLRVQTEAVQRVDNRVAAIRLAGIAGRQIDENVPIRRISFEIALQRFRVNRDIFEFAF